MALITYKIVSDEGGKVKEAARTACNFWNHFVLPRQPIVIRLSVFEGDDETIAQSYDPYTKKGVIYGRIEFNSRFLKGSSTKAAGTIVHEIGHTLGFGFAKWMKLFERKSGLFLPKHVATVPLLEAMLVERRGGDGTELAHWDEEKHNRELMTGFDDSAEHVLPVTIDVMPLLGHKVKKRLTEKTSLTKLLTKLAKVKFAKKKQAKALDLDLFRETDLRETLPHKPRAKRAAKRP